MTTITSKNTLKLDNALAESQDTNAFKIPVRHRLKTKLLLLITLSILIIEALVFIPSVTSMRNFWIHGMLSKTGLLSSIPIDNKIDFLKSDIAKEYFKYNDTLVITLIEDNERKEIIVYKRPPHIDQIFHLNQYSKLQAAYDSLVTIFSTKQKFIQIIDPINGTDKTIELIISSNNLHNSLRIFTYYYLFYSLIIALVAAFFIYTALRKILLAPFNKIYKNLIAFVHEPENPFRIMSPGKRKDELGVAQKQLVAIETELQQSYVQQKHLANLGLAVSKINHDMRNILISAQLISDRLADIRDPVVQKLSPKLIKAIDRATHYSQSVVAYGRTQELPPKPQTLNLRSLVEDVKDTLFLRSYKGIEYRNFIDDHFEVYADSEHLYRILMNLSLNAMQAIAAEKDTDNAIKCITINAHQIDSETIIDIVDTGPGLPARTQEFLFSPFKNSFRTGGTGLGLAICDELIRAHGGSLTLVTTNSTGTHFQIRLPTL